MPVASAAGTFAIGIGPGYFRDEASGDRLWWDGQDIWLAPGSEDIFAVARGTVRFLPAGQRPEIPPPIDESSSTNDVLPCVGDALVLELWPTVHAALEQLMPDDAFSPTYIVYQNVDRDDAVTRMREIIMADPDAHRAFFQEDAEATIDDATLDTRVRAWLRDHWLEGESPGVLVDPTNDAVRIGRAIAPPAPPDELPDDARAETPVPSGAAGWSRLTLKALTEDGKPANALFWLHLVARVESDEWAERPRASDDDAFVTACLRAVEDLRTIRITHQLDADWEISMPPRADMPPALGSLRLHLHQATDTRRLLALIDPTTTTGGHWRMQGPVDESTPYEWEFDGADLYAQLGGVSPPAVRFGEHDVPERGLATRRWFDFGSGPRFILGMNLPTLRRKNGHDLAPNDIRRTMTGDAGYGRAWLTTPGEETARKAAIESDLDNMRAMGIRALRVWVFEQLEGLRFGFTNPALRFGGQTLLEEVVQRFRRVVDGRPYTAVNAADIQTEFTAWAGLPDGLRAVPIADGGADHPTRIVIENAQWLSNAAGARGMRILWCFFAHYGEGNLHLHWDQWFARPEVAADELPVDAWVQRAVFANADLRSSVIEHAVRPFIAAVEDRAACPVEPLGYEIINEADIPWHGCIHGWSTDIDNYGNASYLLSDTEAHAFLSAVATEVRARAPARRLLTVSQQGTYYGLPPTTGGGRLSEEDEINYHLAQTAAERTRLAQRRRAGVTEYMDGVRTELRLFDPLRSQLSCNAISKYFRAPPEYGSWYWRRSSYLPDLRNTALDSLLGGARMIISEAGGTSDMPDLHRESDCDTHALMAREIPRRAMRRGFAGVFLWQYGNPERTTDATDPHAYVERAAQSPRHNHASPLFAGARPAANQIAAFSATYDRFLLPRARP